jgi:hypothetical protein
VLDTPAPHLMRGLSRTGYGRIQSGPLDTGLRRYDEHAASSEVSSSVLARHSGARRNPASYTRAPSLDAGACPVLDAGFRRYDELTVGRGVSTLNKMNPRMRGELCSISPRPGVGLVDRRADHAILQCSWARLSIC